MEVKAVGNELQFGLHLDNGTDGKVKEAWYPLIGGLSKFGCAGKACRRSALGSNLQSVDEEDRAAFRLSDFRLPRASEHVVYLHPKRGGQEVALLRLPRPRLLATKSTTSRSTPKTNAKDVFACIQHLPFTPPGKSFDGSTVVLRVVDGDWHAAGRVYRAWFEKTFGICKPSECWMRRQSFFQFTMFELPEGTINYRFKDIPQWAKDAKDHGVNSVQISGWHLGGHDNGYPYYVVDPRLGTWQELEDGIKACHKMGLKVYFFVNYQPGDDRLRLVQERAHQVPRMAEPGRRRHLEYGVADGNSLGKDGPPEDAWSGPTRLSRSIARSSWTSSPSLAQIGADGVHVDKMFPAAIDYNPNLPMSPDTGPWEGAILLTKEVFAACRKYNPDWAMSFECNWDRLLQFTGATWWVGNQRITRAVFPENAEMLLIAMPYDYLGVNNAVREGHTVMLGPMNFCRSVGWKPWQGLANYIKEVKRIQDSLTDTVYLGEVLGQEGVRIADGPAAGVAYNVFRNISTGKRVCILTNAAMQSKKQTITAFEASPSGEARIHTPFQPAKVVKLPAEIEIPAERIVFVEEL